MLALLLSSLSSGKRAKSVIFLFLERKIFLQCRNSRFSTSYDWYIVKDVRAHCYCTSLLRTPFIKHARATSFSSARTESKTQQKYRASDLGVNLVCQYFCWMLGDPQFFFGRSLPFPILSIILKNKKNLCVGSFNYFS